MDKAVFKRLDVLQRLADKNKPFKVKVLFTDGSEVVTDQSGALDLLLELGPRGKLSGFQADGPMSEWARLLTTLLHPASNREVSDFE